MTAKTEFAGSIRGIEIVEVDEDIVAHARGVVGFKRIVVGKDFMALPGPEQMAVLEHEAAHCVNYDLELRIVLAALLLSIVFLLVNWRVFLAVIVAALGMLALQSLAHWQEYQADRFAVASGHGRGLRAFLKRCQQIPPDELHPAPRARLRALDRKGFA